MSEIETWGQYQKLVLSLLEQHDKKLEQLKQEISVMGSEKPFINENIKNLKKDVENLSILIKEGSFPTPSILNRLESLEHDVKLLIKTDEEFEANKKIQESSLVSYKRTLTIAFIGFFINIGWGLVQAFFLRK